MSFKVIIAGSRQFNNYNFLKNKCDHALKNISEDIIIISGCAKGADKLGEKYALERGYKILKYPAKWDDVEGKPPNEIKNRANGDPYWVRAGVNRNTEMVNNADALIAFDMGTKGIKDTIKKSIEAGLKIKIYESF